MTEISTDIDHLIRTIADRRRIPLKELQKECNIDKKNLDKWMGVLEEEGYIIIQYGLSGTFVIWRGEEEVEKDVVQEPKYDEEYEHVEEPVTFSNEMPMEDITEEPEPPVAPEPPAPSEEEPTVEEEPVVEDVEEAEPEDLLNAYLEKKRSGEETDLKSNILEDLQEEPEKPEPPEAPSEPEEPDDETDHGIDFSKIGEDVEEPVPHTIRPTRESQAADIKELMSSYMKEINREKAQINELKKEKEALLRDTIAPLEGRMQAEIVALTEKIIEKRSRIAELKEHVLELPDKIDEVENLQEGLDRLKEESARALTRTRDKAESYLSNIERSREEIKQRVTDVHSSIEEQTERLDGLEKTSEKLAQQSEKIKISVDAARKQVDQINSAMQDLNSELAALEESKAEIDEMKDAIRDTIGSHGEELEELDAEVEEIGKVEQWVNEYIRDYETKISQIESYVEKSDEELSDLRESAESLYLQKYLGELENMTEAYEAGIEEAVEKERDLDTRIVESKDRIAALVKESREMMKTLRGESDEDGDNYAAILSKIKRKTAKVKKVVEEKSNERKKLTEDSKKTRKTQRTAKTRSAKKKVKKKKK